MQKPIRVFVGGHSHVNHKMVKYMCHIQNDRREGKTDRSNEKDKVP